MSMIPSDLTSHVGQEVSLREVFWAAWRNHCRNFWRGLLCLFVTLLVIAAIQVAAIGLMIGNAMVGNKHLLNIALTIAGWTTIFLAPAFVYTSLGGGLLWSLSRTFDGQPLSLRGLFAGFRCRYRRLLALGLLEFATMAVAYGVPVSVVALLVYTTSAVSKKVV